MFHRGLFSSAYAPATLARRHATLMIRRMHARRIGRHGVIIGGCGRSGTSLLLSALSCHPSLCVIPEETEAFFDYKTQQPYQPLRMERLMECLLRQPLNGRHRHFVEKTPRNIHCFGELLDAFGPTLRLVHIVRDGRDVVTSRHPMQPEGFYVSPQRWIQDVTAGMRFQSHPQVHTLRYEDLIKKPAETLAALCAFIGIPFETEWFQYPQRATVHEQTAWWGGKAVPFHDRSIGRWKEPYYANRIRQLLAEPSALTLLRHFGYE